MQPRKSIINVPLLLCIVLSMVVHGFIFCGYRSTYTPPKQKIDTGRTVIQLTLTPSIAAPAAKPEPKVEPPTESVPEKIPEPVVEKTHPPIEPLAVPDPIPVENTEPPQKKEKPPEPLKESEKPESQKEVIPDPTPSGSIDQNASNIEDKGVTADAIPTPSGSIDQNASNIEDKGVTADAIPIDGIHPVYPRISQRRGNEGTVVLSIQVLANGTPGNITIIQSCGFKRLDEAAVKSARNAQYIPAKKGTRNVEAELIQPIMFKLDNHK